MSVTKIESPTPAPLWYFAYGSNMQASTFYDRRQMRPLATRCARLDGYRLRFNLAVGPGERGVANLELAVGARVYGVLYLLLPEECDRLDFTEGVALGVYHRVPVEVVVEPGERVAAFTYQSTLTQEGRKPSARYRRLLVEGARQHGLPLEYVEFLESFELARDEREGKQRRR
jgi:cation transport regulator ChaC